MNFSVVDIKQHFCAEIFEWMRMDLNASLVELDVFAPNAHLDKFEKLVLIKFLGFLDFPQSLGL